MHKNHVIILLTVAMLASGTAFSEDKDYHIKSAEEEAGYTSTRNVRDPQLTPGKVDTGYQGIPGLSGSAAKSKDEVGAGGQTTVVGIYSSGAGDKTKLTINGKSYEIVGGNVVDAAGNVVGKVIGSGEQRGWKQPSDFIIAVDGQRYTVSVTKIERGPNKGASGTVKLLPDQRLDSKPTGRYRSAKPAGEAHFTVNGKNYTAKGKTIVDPAGNVVGAIEGREAARGPNEPEIIFNVDNKRYGIVIKRNATKEESGSDEGESGTIFEILTNR